MKVYRVNGVITLSVLDFYPDELSSGVCVGNVNLSDIRVTKLIRTKFTIMEAGEISMYEWTHLSMDEVEATRMEESLAEE